MRLAIYYDNVTGRNDGNPLYVWNALKRMQAADKLEIDHLAPMENVNLLGTYDAHLWVDWGEDGLTGLIPYKMIDCPKPSVYWASDTHLGYDYRLNMARKFNKVFCAQKRAVEEFKRDGVEAEWLPHAFEPQAYPKFNFAAKKYDICFIGHINSENRVDALDRMFREFPNFFYGQRLFEDAAEKFCESKIVFNISMLDDVNMRCFETIGTGSCLLTNWLPTIEELGFKDGENCLLYRSLDEAVDKTRFYLKNDEAREKIAQAGYELAINNHTIDHRVDKILKAVNELTAVTA